MLPFLRNTTVALSGALLMLAGCAAPSSPAKTESAPHGTGTPLWASTVSNSVTASQFNATALGSDNLYAVGTIAGTESHDFGNDVTVSGVLAGNNAVVVKYDSTGKALWARTLGSESTGTKSAFVAVATDAAGSVYAAGSITGTSTFDLGSSITTAGAGMGHTLVLIQYNTSGTPVGAQTASSGESNQSCFYGVAADRLGSTYAVGTIKSTNDYHFGSSVTVTGSSSSDNAVLVKFD